MATRINPYVHFPLAALEADGLTQKMLEHMAQPTTNPASWDAQMKGLYAKLLYNIGARAASLAGAAILGAPLGTKIAATWKAARALTQELRESSRGDSHPLKEYGVLGRSIQAALGTDGLSVTIGAPDKAVRSRRPGRGAKAMTLALLLQEHESGVDFEFTQKARVFFGRMARQAEKDAGSEAESGNLGGMAYKSQLGQAYAKMAGMKLGMHHIAARPVLAPAFAQALDEAQESQIPSFAKDFEKLWVMGVKPPAGVSANPGGMSGGTAMGVE